MILRRMQNYRAIELAAQTRGEVVGVLRRDGSLGCRSWCGFIDVRRARRLSGAVPVKLAIVAYAFSDGPGRSWVAVPDARFLQGCLTADGVRCVLVEGHPRVVASRVVLPI